MRKESYRSDTSSYRSDTSTYRSDILPIEVMLLPIEVILLPIAIMGKCKPSTHGYSGLDSAANLPPVDWVAHAWNESPFLSGATTIAVRRSSCMLLKKKGRLRVPIKGCGRSAVCRHLFLPLGASPALPHQTCVSLTPPVPGHFANRFALLLRRRKT